MPSQPNIFQIIKTVLGSPIEGSQALLVRGISVGNALLLLALGFAFVSLFAVAVVSQMYTLSAKTLLFTAKIGLVAVLFLLILGLLTYLATKIFKEVSISRIILVAALGSIVLVALIVLLLAVLLLFKDSLINTFVDGPLGFTPPVILVCLVFGFALLHLINIAKQSMVTSGLSVSASWYLAPLLVAAAMYIANTFSNWFI